MAGRLMEVLLRVNDVSRSAQFYRDTLGLAVEPGDEAQSHYEVMWGRWVGASPDLLMFLIYPADSDHTRTAEIGFSVDDLDAVHAAVVRAGMPVLEGPSMKPWGRQARYRDPDGNVVVVAQAPGG